MKWRWICAFFLTLWICFAWSGVHGQYSEPSAIRAAYSDAEIHIDGKLDEAIWQEATRVDNFTQRELNFGEPVTERTEVAIVYNSDYIYVGVWCYDSEPDEIIAKELRRDFNFNVDDNFIIIFDTYGDKRNGFMFVTNPNAARTDLQIFNNGGSSNTFWNGVWDVRTTKTEEGWFAEFEIPLYTLKYRSGEDVQIWGVNFERNIRRKREQARWQGWNRDNQIQQVNRAGTLLGLDNLTKKQFVEVKPYAIGGGELTPENNRGVANAGGDINYLLSPTYRLNLTFNTDFAQVEADQQQINLTRFPLFFPELREFFLEGNDFFDMGFGGNRIIPFYTRRIGLTDDFDPVPIIAGARLLGKEANSTVGLMTLQTAAVDSQATTNYTTASWRQDIGRQSVIGAMSTNRIENGRWHTTTGINGRYSTASLFGRRNFDFGGAFIQTYNTDDGYDPQAFAYRFFASYPNDLINIFASTQRSPQPFEPEVGLMRRRNFRENFGSISIRPRPKKNLLWIRQFQFQPGQITYTQYDDNGDIQSFLYGLQFMGFDTRQGESFSMAYNVVAEGLREDFEISPGIVIPEDVYWWRQWEASFSTFQGRTFSLSSQFQWGDFYRGSTLQNQTALLWRANKYFNINIRYEKNIVNLPEGSFETDLIGSRIEYALSPNTFGSLLTQWNSSADEFNLNFRLQVIPKIGTDLFFIVNQIWDTQTGSFDPERGTVLAKLIWRFVV